jgi:hypothetical protein
MSSSYLGLPPFNGNFTTIVDVYNVISTGVPLAVQVNTQYDYVNIIDIGNSSGSTWTSSPATSIAKESSWQSILPQGTAYCTVNTPALATDQKAFFTTGGISVNNSIYPLTSAPNTTGTTFSLATAAVWNMVNTFQNGQTVLITDAVGASQLNGMIFTISNVSGTQFTTPYLNTSAFAASCSSFTAQVVQVPTNLVNPALNFITSMTSTGATSTTIVFSYTHNFQVNQTVQVRIPPIFGPVGLGGDQIWTITAVNAVTNSITINAPSAALAAFKFPSSSVVLAQGTGITPAQVTPYGQIPNTYLNTTISAANWYVGLGVNVCGNVGDTMIMTCRCSNNIYYTPTTSPFLY